MEKQIKIALAGNPNCGKTTLFNALTGSNQFVGNWPGVTVEKKEGRLKKHDDVVIMDLPGIYSLSPYTLEEVVARNYLIDERPDAILNIVDGTNLERNLYLTTQLTELGIPVVMAVNMMDIVRKSGDQINIGQLSQQLGCKVVEISALKGTGILEAAEAAVEAGLPLPGLRSARGLGILVLMWSGLLIAGLFASISRSTGMVILTIGMVLFFALVYFLANAARKALQRLRCPPWANLLVIVGICIAMFAGGTTGLFALMIRNAGSGWLEDHPPVETYTAHGMTWSVYADPIPLRVEDLIDIDYDGWSTEADVEWSPLAAHGEYRQDARLGDGDLPELRYEIVTVKLPFLYGLCKRDFIQWVERDNDQLPMEYWEEYLTVTAAPWGAEEVFQRYSGAEPVNQFLLCWPDRMAEVKLPWDWRLTADQMAVIGEKLLHA